MFVRGVIRGQITALVTLSLVIIKEKKEMETITINTHTSRRKMSIDVIPNVTTIANVKQALADSTGIPIDQQSLFNPAVRDPLLQRPTDDLVLTHARIQELHREETAYHLARKRQTSATTTTTTATSPPPPPPSRLTRENWQSIPCSEMKGRVSDLLAIAAELKMPEELGKGVQSVEVLCKIMHAYAQAAREVERSREMGVTPTPTPTPTSTLTPTPTPTPSPTPPTPSAIPSPTPLSFPTPPGGVAPEEEPRSLTATWLPIHLHSRPRF